MTYSSDFVKALSPTLFKLADRKRAIGAQAYMKNIAPFIGVATPERRATVKAIAKEMKIPTSEELGATARKLWKLDEREFQYAAMEYLLKAKIRFSGCAGKITSVTISPQARFWEGDCA